MSDFIGTDAHIGPEEQLPEQVRRFVEAARGAGGRVVFGGDTFDLLPWGMSRWSPETLVVRDLVALLQSTDVFLGGNHDPSRLLRLIVGPHGFDPQPQMESVFGETCWTYTHGHQRSDWFVWRLFAPRVVEYMVEKHPLIWYRLCRCTGWLPGREKKKHPNVETQKYTLMTRGTQSAWETYGERNRCSIAIGHTHKAKVSTTWLAELTRIDFVDAGDLRDRSFAVVGPEGARIDWF